MIYVGDLRRAIEGMADNAVVHLAVLNDCEPFIDIEFVGVAPKENSVIISAECMDESDYEDDEDEDDDEDWEAFLEE